MWLDQFGGFGYYPVDQSEAPYDEAYFEKYARMADTEIGLALNTTRNRMVNRYWSGPIVDVGIGCGSFIESRLGGTTLGYDINPAAVAWLHKHDLYWNPRIDPCPAVTMWDVLEHMVDFPALLANVGEWAFVAVPVFQDVDHVLRSRHFRPDEHCWYFTVAGMITVMQDLGFRCAEVNWNETVLGRDSIASFAFQRV
jgi:hypothetical protein